MDFTEYLWGCRLERSKHCCLCLSSMECACMAMAIGEARAGFLDPKIPTDLQGQQVTTARHNQEDAISSALYMTPDKTNNSIFSADGQFDPLLTQVFSRSSSFYPGPAHVLFWGRHHCCADQILMNHTFNGPTTMHRFP